MYIVTVNGAGVTYGTETVIEKVTFAIEENARLGIIGANGCGKSTLLKLIVGELEPSEGSVSIPKGKTVGILRQDDAFDESDAGMTVTERMWKAFPEHLYEEKRLKELEPALATGDEKAIREYSELHEKYVENGGLTYRSRATAILSKLGFDEQAREQTVASLSGGQRTRLALAVQLSAEPDILLLDEPTNHLDVATLGWLETFLAGYPKCFIVVSHDRYFLDRVTTQTLAIERHRAKLYAGGYTKSMEQRRQDREIAERHWKNQQKEIARQEAYIAQQRAWNRERNIIAAESRQKLLDKMVRVERPQAEEKGVRMKFTEASASGNDVLSVRDLAFGYPGREPLFRGLNFTVKRGDRVLMIGPNGCGKSTLVKVLLGRLAPVRGVVEAGYHVEVGYYDQENQNLTPENTVLDELWNAYPTKTETEIRSALGLFRFTGDAVFRTVSVLSGGERARLTLAKLMLSRMNLLLLDEPTNHLDMDSREALEAALEQFEGTILMVSHDRYLVEKLATRILCFKPPRPFAGDLLDYPVTHPGRAYTEFSAYVADRQAAAETTATGTKNGENLHTVPSKTANSAPAGTAPDRILAADTVGLVQSAKTAKEQYLQAKQQAAEERRRKNRRERLQAECAALEAELTAVEQELFGSAASDYQRAAELDARRTDLESRLMEIYEELE